jgi:hypothetical protein
MPHIVNAKKIKPASVAGLFTYGEAENLSE